MKKAFACVIAALTVRAFAGPLTLSVDDYTPNYTNGMGQAVNVTTITVSNAVPGAMDSIYFSADLTNWTLHDQVQAPGPAYSLFVSVPAQYTNGFFKLVEARP